MKAVVWLQCESVMASLEASHSVALNVGLDTSTPTAKLGSAAAHDNDRFINSEGDRQQLLLRSVHRLLLPMGTRLPPQPYWHNNDYLVEVQGHYSCCSNSLTCCTAERPCAVYGSGD